MAENHNENSGDRDGNVQDHEHSHIPAEPAWLSFLKDVATDVAKLAKNDEIGLIEWKPIQLADNLTCIRLTYKPENNEEIRLNMFLRPRHKDGRNIVRLVTPDKGDGIDVLVEADPQVIVAVIYFI